VVVGHILYYPTKIESDSEEYQTLSLAPVGVIAELQRTGVGIRLVNAGIERAKDMGYGSVIVLGHPEYYPRFGFQPASKWGIKPPFDAPDNAFLALELIEGDLENKSGVVRYPKEFDDV